MSELCKVEKNYNRWFIILNLVPEVCVDDCLDYTKQKETHDDLRKEEQTDQPSHANDEVPKANTYGIEDEYVLYDDNGIDIY